ncbi:MAG: hypothetical protein PHG08_05160 [Bacilli bacterium]|jgi:hypothetical protein|nr:hypothetical protein [Bacilli bacterium]HHU23959.1 hypothetical protein [Acholeplasmataceae bacterium]
MREKQKVTYEELFGELSEHLHQSLVLFNELTKLPSYLKQVKDEELLNHYQKSMEIEAKIFNKLNTDYLPFLPREDLLLITMDIIKVSQELTKEHKQLVSLITDLNYQEIAVALEITVNLGTKLYHYLAHINRFKKIDVHHLLNLINEAQTQMMMWQWNTKVSDELKWSLDKVFNSIVKSYKSFILVCFKNT